MQNEPRRRLSSGRIAVVLGMSETGLSAVRLLGQAGLRCWGVDSHAELPAFASRYCERRILLPEGVSARELARVIAPAETASLGRPLIVPTSDPFVRLASDLRSSFPGRFHMALPPAAALDELLDKRRFALRAAKLGVRVPRTAAVSSLWRLRDDLAYVGYPAIVKPRARDADAAGMPKAVLLSSERDVLSFQALHAHLRGPELVVQEYVPGGDTSELSVAVALDSASRPVASFVARKRRQGNRRAGVGTFVERCSDPEAEQVATRFLQRLGYVGVAEMELKRHARTGELFAIEVNPRLWSQLALPASVGLDFAALYCEIATSGSASGPPERRPSAVTWQNLWSDFYWTFCGDGYWDRGDVSLLSWLYQTLTCQCRSHFAWRDPLPLLRHVYLELAAAARRVAARGLD